MTNEAEEENGDVGKKVTKCERKLN